MRGFFGIEDSKAGLYSASATGEFRNAFLSGELDELSSKLTGGGLDTFKAGMGARAQNLADFEGFAKYLQSGIGEDRLKELGGKLDTSALEYSTTYQKETETISLTTQGRSLVLPLAAGDAPIVRAMQGQSVLLGMTQEISKTLCVG